MIVVFNKDRPIADSQVVFPLRHLLQHQLRLAILWMCLAGKYKLNGTFGIVDDFSQPGLILQQEVPALVTRYPPCESDGQHSRLEDFFRRIGMVYGVAAGDARLNERWRMKATRRAFKSECAAQSSASEIPRNSLLPLSALQHSLSPVGAYMRFKQRADQRRHQVGA